MVRIIAAFVLMMSACGSLPIQSRVDSGVAASDAGLEAPEDPGRLSSPVRLVTADGSSFVIDEVEAALDHALLNSAVRHVILYVHGRGCSGGGEPTKALNGSMPELEADYHSKVVLFTWPGSSNGCPLGFPEPEAREAGPALSHVLHKLALTLFNRKGDLGDITFTMVTHSLGNVVLEESLRKDTRVLPTGMIATVVLSASATALQDHQSWLSKLQYSRRVYVAVNDGDLVLAAAALGRSPRLGKNLSTEALATNALYVDFTSARVSHDYFTHSGQKGVQMRTFFDTVMEGKDYDFAASTGLARTEARNGTFVHVFDGR